MTMTYQAKPLACLPSIFPHKNGREPMPPDPLTDSSSSNNSNAIALSLALATWHMSLLRSSAKKKG